MSRGKYSPNCPHAGDRSYEYKYNADKQIPPDFDPKTDVYNERLHFGDYDSEGFDRYGYSAFDENGKFVGLGNGVDRNGYTEMDYMSMSDDEFFYHL